MLVGKSIFLQFVLFFSNQNNQLMILKNTCSFGRSPIGGHRPATRPASLPLLLLMVCCLLTGFHTQTWAQINFPGGRIALSYDGNIHDQDDWGASAMALAMLDAAGLNSKVVHLDYNNHLSQSVSAWEQEMIKSTMDGAKRFGFNSAVFFNNQTQLSASISHLASAINASSSNNPLWIIAGGPMETVWRGINAAQRSQRKYVKVVSHSAWNESHDQDDHGGSGSLDHNWNSLKSSFQSDGVVFYDHNYVKDQNNSNGEYDFNTSKSYWYWLRDSSNPDLQWLYSRNYFSDKFDVSDAGMVYWLMTGGPNGGCSNCGWKETKALLEKNTDNSDDDDDDDEEEKENTTSYKIPGAIEAENYAAMSGIQTEPSSDQGGGDDIGYIESGDWVEYKVEVAGSGKYQVDFRVASDTKGGDIILKNGSTTLGSITVANTGGWQQWKTISTIVSLTKGTHTYRLQFTGDDGYLLNVNRMSFAASAEEPNPSPSTMALSPIQDAYLQDDSRYNTGELRAELDKRTTYLMFDLSSVSGNITSAKLQLTVGSDPGYGTIKVLLGKGTDWTEDNLSTGNAPTPVATLGSLDTEFSPGKAYTWNLSNINAIEATGGKLSLIVTHPSGNDVAFISKENSNTSGRPTLILTTDGDANARVALHKSKADLVVDGVERAAGLQYYPNPVRSALEVNLSSYDQPSTLTIQDMSGKIVHQQQVPEGQPSVRLLLNQPAGMYVLKIISGKQSQTVKLLKE